MARSVLVITNEPMLRYNLRRNPWQQRGSLLNYAYMLIFESDYVVLGKTGVAMKTLERLILSNYRKKLEGKETIEKLTKLDFFFLFAGLGLTWLTIGEYSSGEKSAAGVHALMSLGTYIMAAAHVYSTRHYFRNHHNSSAGDFHRQ